MATSDLPRDLWGNPQRIVSQGGGAQVSFSAGDERSEAENANFLSTVVGLTAFAKKWDAEKGAAAERGAAAPAPPLPCLSITTASKDSPPPLPGPRKKQAYALTENIKWMADTFGQERIGFLTLTLGDVDAGGKYRNLRDRKEAQRRFHSLLTNEIAKRYNCGVTVTERHHNGGIHFHLVVACKEDIRGGIDFSACFPPKDARGKPRYKPDYSTANETLIREWAYWRRTTKFYGFGRHQLQPLRQNGEALGRYLGAYLRKDWEHRLAEDKGSRCVRYFGHWSKTVRGKGERKQSPPHNAQFGWVTPQARAWREMIKQVVTVLNYKGAKLTEENIKAIIGSRWAWRMSRLFQAVRFETEHLPDKAVREAIEEHNFKVQVRWLSGGGNPAQSCWWHVTGITLDHLRPSPEWIRQGEELQLAKEREGLERQGQKELALRLAREQEKLRLLREAAQELQAQFREAKGIWLRTCAERSTSA